MVSWRDQPTRHDIEALQANIRRVGLVIRVRWILIVVLVFYSIFGGMLYATRMPVPELARLMWIPALALGVVVLYNTFYTLNYRRLGNIAVWNHLQLGLDALVVTILVYFSGGANSWFWSMYSLFILEATFILPRSRDAWLLAAVCMALLGSVEWLELAGVLPHAAIPYAEPGLHADVIFVLVRYLWQVAVLAGTAWVATLLVGDVRHQIESLRASQTVLDTTTGLYSRGYFMRIFPEEVNRAQRDGRTAHVLLVDLDRFGEFNTRFGIDMGDSLLRALGSAIATVVAEFTPTASATAAARIGGEEFAVFVVDETGTAGASEADTIGERLRAAIEATRIEGAGVTASVGIASLPEDATSSEELLDAADAALSHAVESGGNRVVTAARAHHAAVEAASSAEA